MRNSTAPVSPKEATTNVVYKFSCQEGRCDGSSNYIGRTSTTLRRRMPSHRNQGSIFQHFTDIHIMKPPLQKLLDQTEIIHKVNYFRKLQISEAVSITYQRPSINVQQAADFILPSARPQDRNTPPVQHQLQGNQLTGPVTRSRSRASGSSSLPQDQVNHPLANHRAPWEPSQPMAVQPRQPTRTQLGLLFHQSGPPKRESP
ncbi:hypothetical protein Pmani_013042 [Petrolisthes manimaculis]|uniref:GIY-YIG domain-containing protein n=1 Tax=Petrolisthes manimaculis TaxID=1843537 RepID=A0AAE1PW17_9EUCA|nr:hypothetical protein Pmani_013042 [Petrolisthes manimaculis]